MVQFPATWPENIHVLLTASYGLPLSIDLLGGGQSQANVWRISWSKQSVIVKRSNRPNESFFYTTVAPLLREAGIPCLANAFTFQTVAARYLKQDGRPASMLSEPTLSLARDIAIAKAWSVTEYLSLYNSGALPRTTKIEGLIQQFPEWLDRVVLGKS